MLVSLCDARASVCTYVGIPSVMREALGERLDVDPEQTIGPSKTQAR